MARKITWLHLSDLHAGSPDHWDAEPILEKLIQDLKKLNQSSGLTPDLMFFTGDVAFGERGRGEGETLKEQYVLAQHFFNTVREAFTPVIPITDFFIVPGNHDVNRNNISTPTIDYLAQIKDINKVQEILKKGGIDWRQIVERLDDYRQFLEQYQYLHLLSDPKRLIFSGIRDINSIKVGIGGFNSAWSCGRNKEKGSIWLCGDWQYNCCIRPKIKDADLQIMLVHHPVNWLVEQEDPVFSRIIENNIDFLLHGHEHQTWVSEKGKKHKCIGAAACYNRSDGENGYNLVHLDLDEGIGQVWLRMYDKSGEGWIPRIISGKTDDRGVWDLSLPSSSISAQDKILFTSKNITAQENFALETLPSSWAVYQPEPPLGRDAERDQSITLLRDNRVLLLYGAPGQGKTALARYIAISLKSSYTDGIFEIDLQSEKQINNITKQIGIILGDTDTGNPFQSLHSKKALIILNSFERILHSHSNDIENVTKFLNVLIRSLSGDSRIIITSQEHFKIDGLVEKKVPILSKDFAIELLHRESDSLYRSENEDKVADFVLNKLGGHPLSIKIVARYSRESGLDLDVLDQLWSKKWIDFAPLIPGLNDKALTTSFELSYASLGEIEKRFFIAMSLLPDGIIGNDIQKIWGDEDTKALGACHALATRSLLESEQRKRKMLGPIFLYAQEKRRTIERDDKHPMYASLQKDFQAIDNFYDQFIRDNAPQETDIDPREKNRVIREHFQNIHASLDRRINPSTKSTTLSSANSVLSLYWAYHNNLSGYKNAISSPEDAVHYLDKASDIFRINDEQEKSIQCKYYIGKILWLRDELNQAESYLKEVIDSQWSSEEIKHDCKRALAHIQYKVGSIPKAISLYEEIIEKADIIGDVDCRLRCQIGLIDAYRKLEKFDEAIEQFNSLRSELPSRNPSIRGNFIRGYAYALSLKGDLQEAESQYIEALGIFDSVSPFGQAHCKRGLGDVYVKMKRFDEANVQFNESITLYNEARKNPSLGVGLVYLGMGRLALAQNQISQALDQFSNIIELFDRQRLNEPFEQAVAYECMGDAFRQILKTEEALGNYQLALASYQKKECKLPVARMKKMIARLKLALD